MSEQRVVKVRWTEPAADKLRSLPKKIQATILAKTKALTSTNPKKAHKPLTQRLKGYYSLKVSRYRVVYGVSEDRLPNGDTVIHVIVTIVIVGQRKAGDKRDVYQLATKLVSMISLAERRTKISIPATTKHKRKTRKHPR